MKDSDNLSPPKRTGIVDPGAHDLAESSESDDHFSDAQSAPISPAPTSPVPRTRVEKVGDEPSYGEVPGTEAYLKREGDAKPDEITVISDKATAAAQEDKRSSPPGGRPIPETVVEESPGSTAHHSEEFEKRRQADARPDLILKAESKAENSAEASRGSLPSVTDRDAPDSPISPALISPRSGRARRKSSRSGNPMSPDLQSTSFDTNGKEEEDGFGDDFDDFEEGGDDADFDDFGEGFQQEEQAPAHVIQPPATLPFPIPDFEGLDFDDLTGAIEPYINALFPPDELDIPDLPLLSKENPIFLTPRSASLWAQLVAPPPLAPPDWIRSRIRRLFLVSLGVPVDLDEILPASKQKKLILPSLHHVNSSGSLRTSTDSRSISRLKQTDANASSTSVDSQGKPSSSKRRKGPPPEPELDLVSAKHLCMTTDAALGGMTDGELKGHVSQLEAMEGKAKELLEYWQKRTDEKIGDREAFEGVIENLVKHARKVRK